MDRSGAQSQLGTRRQPLSDATSRANIDARSPKRQKQSQKPLSASSPRSTRSNNSNGLPHHESLMGHGKTQSLTVRQYTSSPEDRREKRDKRVSAVAEELESKRSSQASTASGASGQPSHNPRKTHVGPWRLGNSIGKGMCGVVRKTRHSVTHQDAAVKIIAKKVAEKNHAQSLADLIQSTKHERPSDPNAYLIPFGLEREIVIMKLLRHPHVVELYDVWENRNEIYLVMEYVDGGELFQYIYDSGRIVEDEAVWIFRQIVAALLHCHRLGITHRDLKPENILLTYIYDPETEGYNPQVKVADFGMAALQPRGKKLTTPCGSMHYAAPEVFEQIYDGSKIDVWSLGVILYAMLFGNVPFELKENQDWREWYKTIKRGSLNLGDEDSISLEASNLIRHMLTPDPRRRIGLEAAWKHPLFRKWSNVWGETEAEASMETWVGARPEIGRWSIWTKDKIDREILRNLRALWHREKEEVLIQRLLSKEANVEKLFYAALQRHTEEQLENYSGLDGVLYSGSDYHHIKPVLQPNEVPPIPPSAYSRTKSQFSIMNDIANPSKSTLHQPPPSESSYDPFRASRDPIITGKDQYNVTVHRGASSHSRRPSVSKHDSLRVHALRNNGRLSTASSLSSVPRVSASPRPGTAHSKRSISRTSVTSSQFRSSPPVSGHAKTTILPRRGVNFSHLRRSSSTSAIASPSRSRNATSPRPPLGTPKVSGSPVNGYSSPLAEPRNRVGSRKETASIGRLPSRPRKSQTEGNIVDAETRKVSSELEKACDEAFFRSSAGSSYATSMSQNQPAYETPPSSISNRASGHSQGGHPPTEPKRPLPEPPQDQETPNTFLSRELAEVKRKLEQRYLQDKGSHPAYHEVQSLLDNFTKPADPGWAPRGRSPVPSSQLPMISEEGKTAELDDSKRTLALRSHPPRGIEHDLFVRPVSSSVTPTDPQSTIRVIEPVSPPPRIAPLNIRKTSSTSSQNSGQNVGDSHSDASVDQPGARFYRGGAAQGHNLSHKTSLPTIRPLRPITEDAAMHGEPEGEISLPGIVPRKRGWFKRTFGSGSEEDRDQQHSPKSWEGTPPKNKRKFEHGGDVLCSPGSGPKPVVPGKRPGFLGFLTRKRNPKQGDGRMVIGESDSAMSTDSVPATMRGPPNRALAGRNIYKQRANGSSLAPGEDQQRNDGRDLGVRRSWFTRFLHIKPASRIMCFDAGRGKVRSELVRLLRNWRMYGLRDVVLDREKNLIFGRLAADNHLGIKEVAFVVELFVVLEHGHRANLCIARFTQRKGAASSFRKLVDTVENMMAGRRLLVEDTKRCRDMEAILLG